MTILSIVIPYKNLVVSVITNCMKGPIYHTECKNGGPLKVNMSDYYNLNFVSIGNVKVKYSQHVQSTLVISNLKGPF